MKSLRVGLAVWVLCAMVLGLSGGGLVLASGLPDNLGSLQDRAGFFTAEQKAEIKQDIASMEHLGFYVLTVASLNDRDAAEYTTAVYDHWGLEERDVLLLISQQERRVELNFNNSDLQEAIETTLDEKVDIIADEVSLSGLLNAVFIPHARVGDFQQGIRQTIQALELIGAKIVPKVPVVVAEEKVAVPDASPVQEYREYGWGPFKSSLSKASNNVLKVSVVAAIVLLIYELFRRGYKGIILFKKITAARRANGQLMVEISRALERLSPVTEMSQGLTSKKARELEIILTDMLVIAKANSQEDKNLGLYVLHTKKMIDLWTTISSDLDTLKKSAEKAMPSAHELADLEQVVPKAIERLKAENKKSQVVYEELVALLDGPIDTILREFRELDELLGKAEELAMFDVLAASEWTDRSDRLMAALSSDLQELLEHARRQQSYPEKEREARQYVKHIIEEHNLYEREQEIYGLIEKSLTQVPFLQQALRKGETIRARTVWQGIEQLLAQAKQKADWLAELQRSNNEKLAILEEKVKGIEQFVNRLDQEFFRLSNEYKKTLWAPLEQKLNGLKRELKMGHSEMDKAKDQQFRQQFDRAKEILDDLAVGAKQLNKELLACEKAIVQLDLDKKECQEYFASNKEDFYNLHSEIASSDIIIFPEVGLDRDYLQIENLGQNFRELENNWPLDLKQLLKLGEHYKDAIAKTRRKYEKIKAKKESVLETVSEYHKKFYYLVEMADGMFYKMGRKRAFRKLHKDIFTMINSGHYDDALEACEELEELVEEVADQAELANRQREYERTQERLREEARAARAAQERIVVKTVHHHHKSNSSSSTGSFFGGGGSSSRSSTSSSSRASDSSASRSSSSQSSGGSNWSEPSNRSSGGSSFDNSSSGGGSKSNGQSSGGSNW